MNIIKQLEQIGLSEKEAKIYMALLEMGEATPQELSIKSGINRATTYVILENLEKRDLCKIFAKKKKTFCKIENPLHILDFLENEKTLLNEKISKTRKIMPELEMLGRLTSERTKIKFFEGKEGISLIQKDVMKSKARRIDNIININIILKSFPSTANDHRNKIVKALKRKTKFRTIAIYDPKKPVPKLPIIKGEERRYLPLNKFPFYADFTIYKNKLSLISIKNNLIGVIIENNDIAQGFQSLFELAWRGAGKYIAISEKK